MKMLKLLFIITLFILPAEARRSDSLTLRAHVSAILTLPKSFKTNENAQFLKDQLLFNGDKRKFNVKKIENKNQVYLEVTFH